MSQNIVGCPINADLSSRTEKMISDLRNAPGEVPRGDVIDLVVELTEASFQYHFVRPLKDLGVGFATRKGIDVGLMGAVRVIRSSMQKVIKAMDDSNYAKLADFLEQAYFPGGKAG